MSGLKIAVVGATGALGTELLRVLAEERFPIAELIPIASRATSTPKVEFDGRSLSVRDLSPDSLEGVDVVFAALPAGREVELLEETAEAGCIVVDLAQNWAASLDAPVAVAGVNPVELDAVREQGRVVMPGPVALAHVELGAALGDLGIASMRGTALMSAAVGGRRGIEELSRQVAALFNSQDPPRQIFAEGLAFDLVPVWGEGVAGWTAPELMTARHVGRVLAIDPRQVVVTQVLTPIFLGLGLSLHVQTLSPADLVTVARLLEAWPRTVFEPRSDRSLQPRAVTGESVLRVGRLRSDPGGEGFHLWAVADPLSLAADRAVALVAALVDAGLV